MGVVMRLKNDVEVLINGRKYTICGYESAEYIQKIANYINSKYNELQEMENFSKLDLDLKNIFLQINVADDYQKAHKRVLELEEELELKEKETFDLKHELVLMQTNYEELEKEMKGIREKLDEKEKEIIKLQTELKSSKGRTR
jgi:cell division protein ZapA